MLLLRHFCQLFSMSNIVVDDRGLPHHLLVFRSQLVQKIVFFQVFESKLTVKPFPSIQLGSQRLIHLVDAHDVFNDHRDVHHKKIFTFLRWGGDEGVVPCRKHDLLAVGLVTSVVAVHPPVAAEVHVDAVAAEAGELLVGAGGEHNVTRVSGVWVAPGKEVREFLSVYQQENWGNFCHNR